MGKDDFPVLTKWLHERRKVDVRPILEKYGRLGVAALQETTPKDTGLTSRSWRYEITETNGRLKLEFLNSNIQDGQNVALLIQFGHGTASGYWVAPRDYVNPALSELMERMEEELNAVYKG